MQRKRKLVLDVISYIRYSDTMQKKQQKRRLAHEADKLRNLGL